MMFKRLQISIGFLIIPLLISDHLSITFTVDTKQTTLTFITDNFLSVSTCALCLK